ncbi:FMN reductase [Microtetraspora sp. NBRC 13810]|uniref:NADPH-dependent FMN reductase n=1 Tax=Microtetraspora sp. NBRC 13810 TaxID=3030990 RepID=UPI0024A129D8|nr:NAD(P)H-dependent oxidoreductase [Microtetraspora sp. NBRC 13810]GLW06920.1 FMN reductase [Microtetraspora sp. NBRC 13810]
MPDKPLQLAVILGSVREGRFGPTVAHWFADRARRHGDLNVDLIDLADHPLPLVLPGFGSTPPAQAARTLASLTPRLAAADAFVVVTPEYNHSFPAPLKNLIDWHNHQWHAKPVAFVSYGGVSGGLRAVEHLRPVFAELHAVTIRDTVSFHNAHGHFGVDGTPVHAEECDNAATILLDRLSWWARALREARHIDPYAA